MKRNMQSTVKDINKRVRNEWSSREAMAVSGRPSPYEYSRRRSQDKSDDIISGRKKEKI